MLLGSCHVGGPSSPSSTGSTPTNNLQTRWNRLNFPINLKISSDFTDYEATLIDEMKEVWDDDSVVNDTAFFTTPASETPNLGRNDISSYKDSTFGIYKSYNWFPNVDGDALAITQYFAKRMNPGSNDEYLELFHADIIINYKSFTFSNNPGFGEYDLSSVVLHELGHLLGLKHEMDFAVDSVMQPFMLSRVEERSIYPSDETALSNNYDETETLSRSIYNRPVVGEEVVGIIEHKATGKCTHKKIYNY